MFNMNVIYIFSNEDLLCKSFCRIINPTPDSVVLAAEEKKEEYAKPRTKGRGVSYGIE